MAAGKISIQANDGKVAGVVFEDGASTNQEVVIPKEGGILASEAYVDAKTATSSKIFTLLSTGGSNVPKNFRTNVASNANVTVLVMYSSTYWLSYDGGLSWTSRTAPAVFYNICVTPSGLFVASTYGTTSTVYTSNDGVSWTPQDIGASVYILNILFANNKIYLMTSTNVRYSSPDGVNWTAVTGTVSPAFSATNGTTTVVVGPLGDLYAFGSDEVYSIVYNDVGVYSKVYSVNGKFICVSAKISDAVSSIYYSSDGINWVSTVGFNLEMVNQIYNIGSAVYKDYLVYANGVYIFAPSKRRYVTGVTQAIAYISNDGISWYATDELEPIYATMFAVGDDIITTDAYYANSNYATAYRKSVEFNTKLALTLHHADASHNIATTEMVNNKADYLSQQLMKSLYGSSVGTSALELVIPYPTVGFSINYGMPITEYHIAAMLNLYNFSTVANITATTASYAIPATARAALIIAVGGGGGGGEGTVPSGAGYGGSAGGIAWTIIPVYTGDTLNIVIGAGGVGGTGVISATSGGNTSVVLQNAIFARADVPLLDASGGTGGSAYVDANNCNYYVAPYNFKRYQGGTITAYADPAYGGSGGEPTFLGKGGNGGTSAAAGAAGAANTGAGGGGGYANATTKTNGGAGGSGKVIVMY